MAGDLDGEAISIPIGITVGLLASFVQSLGLTIQRKSHVINQSLPEEQQKVERRRPLWLLGFAIFISSNLFGSVFQIASLPVVILAPLGAVSLLWNAFFARILLGDVFSVWMLIGTLLIAGGAVLIAIFGIVPEPTHSLEDLLELFNRPLFIVYFSLLGLTTIVSLAITHIIEYSYKRRISLPSVSPPLSPLLASNTQPSILTTAMTDSFVADPSERTPLLDRKPHPRFDDRSKSPSPSGSSSSRSILSNVISLKTQSTRTPLFMAASYASFSGIISGMCLLFAKSGVELLMLTIGGDNQFWRWQAWALLLSLGVCALLQLWYMHKSLILADPTVICPLAFCLYNLSSIFNGLVYFDQFSLLSTMQLLLVLLGILILLAGVWIVSFPPTGGYSIGIGAWAEDDRDDRSDISADESTLQNESEDEENDDEPLRRRSRAMTVPSSSFGEAIGMDRVPREVEVIAQPPSPVAPAHVSSPIFTTFPARPRRLPTNSLRRSRSSYGGEGAVPTSPSSRRRRTTLAAPLSVQGPLAPNAPALPAFSIGLSPMSPGFSLVPTERRRSRVGAESMWRAVSDGDVLRGHDVEAGQAGAREEGSPELATTRPAKGRWKLVHNVFGTLRR
ncbi:uncharacterized protein LAESUDRAFT_661136 [Laetiporus sulphureus 93-53]|uniref:DUF803-domain-containing protein n=1 Tax=Laetiporus sulphureus 93-53 TaxID=1314785 RepID=A0A165CF50_9APHY|nr:uncharacterized protein LAESUDRAFT_661136 [Laetiporus sulphureus 93-53]KZT02702.1 hypothetical protein LAESUDRAFT_661136 [Laetiporus sulphureus 93-53]